MSLDIQGVRLPRVVQDVSNMERLANSMIFDRILVNHEAGELFVSPRPRVPYGPYGYSAGCTSTAAPRCGTQLLLRRPDPARCELWLTSTDPSPPHLFPAPIIHLPSALTLRPSPTSRPRYHHQDLAPITQPVRQGPVALSSTIRVYGV